MNAYFDPDKFQTSEIFTHIIAKWKWFVATCLIMLLAAGLYLKTAQPVYEVTGSLLLKAPEGRNSNERAFMKETGLFLSNVELEDKIGILSSHSLIKKTIQKLPVGIEYYDKSSIFDRQITQENAPFLIRLDSSHKQLIDLAIEVSIEGQSFRLKAKGKKVEVYDLRKDELLGIAEAVTIDTLLKANQLYNTSFLSFEIKQNPLSQSPSSNHYSFVIRSAYDLANEFSQLLTIQAYADNANIVQINSRGPFIGIQKEFTNQLMQQYLQEEKATRNQLASQNIDFIDTQIKATVDSLRNTESLLESFRTRNNIIDVSTTSKELTDQLRELDSKESSARVQGMQATNVISVIKEHQAEGGNIGFSTLNISDPVLSALLVQLSELNNEQAEMGSFAKESNPQYKMVEQQIQSTERAILDAAQSIIASSAIAEKEIKSRVSLIKNKISTLPRSERNLIQIERQFELIDEKYKYLQEKRAEAAIARANQTNENSIIDVARLVKRKPVSPKRGIVLGLALILGLALPLAFIFATDMLNEKIIHLKHIALNTTIPIIGRILEKDIKQDLISPAESDSLVAESFRALRIQLQYLNAEFDQQIIGITSTKTGEGKSYISANFASICAQAGQKTLLIDLDLRSPSLLTYFPSEKASGIVSFLTEGKHFKSLIEKTNINKLSVIHAGPVQYTSLDLLSRGDLEQALAGMRDEYDRIIIDIPPIASTSDYFIIREWLDYTAFVVRHGYTHIQALDRINQLFEEGKVTKIGIVINRVDNPSVYNYGERSLYGYNQTKKKKA